MAFGGLNQRGEMGMGQGDQRLHMNRRSFLGLTAAGMAGGLALPAVLAACGSGVGSTGASGSDTGVLPTYVPEKVPPPQLAGNDHGLPNAYFDQPKHLVQTVHETPGKGGQFTALVITYSPPPTPLGQNLFWQEFNKRLGSSFAPIIVSSSDYQTKLATVMASNDLPDFMLMPPPVPNELAFLQAKCQDLTEFIGGDAVKEYPNLANIPTHTWRNGALGGRMYGLVEDQGYFAGNLFFYQDMADQVGIPHPRNTDDFTRLMKALTRPDKGIWGMGATQRSNYNLSFFQQLFGAPNNWKVEGGKFTHAWETEETKAAISYATELFKLGIFYPNSNNLSTTQGKNGFYGRHFASYQDGFWGFNTTWAAVLQINPSWQPRILIPFGHSGGPGSYFTHPGSVGLIALKKAPKSRIRELLSIANYLAAPFGSVENSFLKNGIEGVDYTLNASGNPIQTERGMSEMQLQWSNITQAPGADVNFQFPDYVKTLYQTQVKLLPLGVNDPTIGLYSNAAASVNAMLTDMANNAVSAIISGRQPMSTYGQFLSQWRSQGGDQMRREYQHAYQSSHKKS